MFVVWCGYYEKTVNNYEFVGGLVINKKAGQLCPAFPFRTVH